VISHLLDPLLNLHGWEAYALIGALVFSEAAILIGFVFPGETAVIVGGVAASRGHINIVTLIVVVDACAIAGDSVGYVVGREWGQRLLDIRLLRRRQHLLQAALRQLRRRGALAVIVGRFTAFLRAVIPGLAGVSSMPYRIFLPANATGGILWGTAYCLLGYFVGHAYTKVEHVSGVASDVLLGVIVVVIVILFLRRRHRERPDGAEESTRT
jgi:membrane-associated protein